MGTGTVQELTDEQEKVRALTKIMEHMADGAAIEFLPDMLARTGVYRIDVKHFSGKARESR